MSTMNEARFHDLIDAAVAYLKARTRHLESMAHRDAKKDSDAK